MNTKKSPFRMAFFIVTMLSLAFLVISLAPRHAQASDSTSQFAQPSFADVFERVSPAVVNISIEKKAQVNRMSGGPNGLPGRSADPRLDDFFGRFFGAPNDPAQSMPSRALGSGLVMDPDGYIVTNNHVIEGAESITVTLEDGREFDAELIGADPKTDLALLKIATTSPLTSVAFGNSDSARVGEWVLAVGNPFGLGGTATFGIISAIGRDIQSGPYDNYLQIDAPINSGNSGGPVFNADGEVIGINTAIFSPNGGNVGIGFAIPAAQVISVTNSLKDHGHVSRGWLGVQIQEIDEDLAQNLNVEVSAGILVADVVKDSPADKAKLKIGDVITNYDGRPVTSPKELSRFVAESAPNAKVRIDVLRDGKQRRVVVQLGDLGSGGTVASNNEHSNPEAEKLGMSLVSLSDKLRSQLGLDEDVHGVVVSDVTPDSVAGKKGIRRGDLILSIDNKGTPSTSDFELALASAKSKGDTARFLVRRGEGQQFIALGLS